MRQRTYFYKKTMAKSCLYFLFLFMFACGSKDETKENIILDQNTANTQIDLTNTQFSSNEMQLDSLKRMDFAQLVKASGIFDVPPENKASVSAYFGGYVKDLGLLPGQEIKKGQLLFTLENPEYLKMQEDYLIAKGQLSYLKSDYQRQKSLASENVTSQKNFLKAESEFKVTSAKYESLRRNLQMMNINPDKISDTQLQSTIAVYSPISGFITNVGAEKGMFLNPSDIAVTITNHSDLHLELKVFENDFPKIKIGQNVRFQLQNDPGTSYEAVISLISRSIDQESRTATVHCHLKNEKQIDQFAPGMYIQAEILTSNHAVLSLPETAIVNIEEQYFVLVLKNKDKETYSFEKREVQVGASEKAYTEIRNAGNFKSTDLFLVDGAFNLIND